MRDWHVKVDRLNDQAGFYQVLHRTDSMAHRVIFLCPTGKRHAGTTAPIALAISVDAAANKTAEEFDLSIRASKTGAVQQAHETSGVNVAMTYCTLQDGKQQKSKKDVLPCQAEHRAW